MNLAIISIGSNIDPEQNIEKMLAILEKECQVQQVSEFVRTKPIGMEDQPDFVNGAAQVATELPQDDFKRYLKSVEDALGRDRSLPKFGPRTMDLDIVVWNGEVVDEDFYTRGFLRDAVESLGFKKE